MQGIIWVVEIKIGWVWDVLNESVLSRAGAREIAKWYRQNYPTGQYRVRAYIRREKP